MTETNLDNIFPDPKTLNKEKNLVIVYWINDKMDQQDLNFHDMLDKLRESVDAGDKHSAMIWAYYVTNIVLKNKRFDDITIRTQTVIDIRDLVESIES
jgi:hypothetical protein